jgi:hypothetical protein
MKIIVVMESPSDSFEEAEQLKASIEGHMIPEHYGTGDVQMWVEYTP